MTRYFNGNFIERGRNIEHDTIILVLIGPRGIFVIRKPYVSRVVESECGGLWIRDDSVSLYQSELLGL